MEATLGLEDAAKLPVYELGRRRRPFEATRQGERVAEEDAAGWGSATGPSPTWRTSSRTQGVWASGVRGLPSEMSGIFLRHSSIGLVILVNYGHPKASKRFSYAHEYAHALLDRKTTSAIVSRKENSQEFIERTGERLRRRLSMPARRALVPGSARKGRPEPPLPRHLHSAGGEPAEAEERPAPGSQQITYQDVVPSPTTSA